MKTRLFQVSLVAVAGLGSLLLCCPVAAQGAGLGGAAGGKKAPAKAHFKGLAQELNLTAAQKQQLKPILREEAQKLKTLRVETGVTKRQKHAQLVQIHRDTLARIKGILTAEQLEKWQKLRAQHATRHQNKRHPPTAEL